MALSDTGGSVTNSYWDVNSTGQSTSVGGIGLTTGQLKTKLPSGFNNTVWGLYPVGAIASYPPVGAIYPYMKWQSFLPVDGFPLHKPGSGDGIDPF